MGYTEQTHKILLMAEKQTLEFIVRENTEIVFEGGLVEAKRHKNLRDLATQKPHPLRRHGHAELYDVEKALFG